MGSIVNLAFGELSYNDSILTCLQKNGCHVSYSCLSGRCNSCKVRLISGRTGTQKPEVGLTLDEKSQGYILACIHKPLSDLIVEVNELIEAVLEKPRTLPAKIDALERMTPEVIRVWLRMPPNSQFRFLPGQYVNLMQGAIKRSYSIAGQDENGRLELLIKQYENGAFSKYLFENAKVNDLLRIEGPLGTFFKRTNPVKQVVLLATGTGIAPIKAMLNDKSDNNPWNGKEISLFYGCRTLSEVLYSPVDDAYAARFTACLSREQTGQQNIFAGYVQDAVLQSDIDLTDAEVYACGSNNMIREARQKLIAHGLPANRFYSDAFVSTN